MNSNDSVSTASSSVKSSSSMEDSDNCNYYPYCRKDTNCNCKMCLASISATLDLLPESVQKSTLTKLSASRKNVKSTPLSFDSSVISTPKTNSFSKMESPLLKSTARVRLNVKKEKKKRNLGYSFKFLKLVSVLSLFYAMKIGFSWVSFEFVTPAFTRELVKGIAERSLKVSDLSGRLRFIEKELKGFVAASKIMNCSNMDSKWKVNQESSVLNSQCILYKSAMEEIRIWGWPLQTAGVLTTGFSSTSYIVLSGRVTEWAEGKIRYSIRKARSSWEQSKWSSAVIQMDPNTWILEYGRSSMLDESSFALSLLELLKHIISRMVKKIRQGGSLFSAYEFFTQKDHIKIPT